MMAWVYFAIFAIPSAIFTFDYGWRPRLRLLGLIVGLALIVGLPLALLSGLSIKGAVLGLLFAVLPVVVPVTAGIIFGLVARNVVDRRGSNRNP